MQIARSILLSLALAAAMAMAITGCGRKDKDTPLAFAPADTAYVFANLKPVPDAVTQVWFDLLKPLNAALGESVAALRAELAAHPDAKAEKLLAMLTLAEGRLSIEGVEKMGIRRDALAAVYGVNLLPVLRIELADPDAFRAFIADLEKQRGSPLPVAEIDGHQYWRVEAQAGMPALVVAILDKHLVATLDTGAKGSPLAEQLGLKRPAHSLLESGELAQLNRDYGFGQHGTFLFDNKRLAGALVAGEGKDAGFAGLLAAQGKTLSPACRRELAGFADAVPRVVGGYDKLEAKAMAMTSIVELRPDLLQGLLPVAAPVPGLGGAGDGKGINFGFGAKLDKLAEFLQARATVINATPYQCEWFAALNTGAFARQLGGLYMAAGWFSGARIALTDLKWAGEKPEAVAATLVIASPNPAGLIGMAQGFVPQLARLNLSPTAEPQPIDLGPLAGGALPAVSRAAFIAVREGGIGIAIGANAKQSVLEHLTAKASAPPPLMHMGYDGAIYSVLVRKLEEMVQSLSAMARVAEVAAHPGKAPGPDIDKAMAPMVAALNGLSETIDQVSADVIVTERGIEIRQQMTLK
jgi:predicted small lipoprotein YifL